MAEEQRREGGGNGFLYFAIGALVVSVAVLAWMMLRTDNRPSNAEKALGQVADSVSDAADSISDSAREAAENMPEPAPAQPDHAQQ